MLRWRPCSLSENGGACHPHRDVLGPVALPVSGQGQSLGCSAHAYAALPGPVRPGLGVVWICVPAAGRGIVVARARQLGLCMLYAVHVWLMFVLHATTCPSPVVKHCVIGTGDEIPV